MTQHAVSASAPAGRPSIAELVRAAGREISGRAHAASDARALALGWEITEPPACSA